MKKFSIFWHSGFSELVFGNCFEDGLTKAGYGKGAYRGMAFWSTDDCRDNWQWNEDEGEWNVNKIKGENHEITSHY